MVRFSFFFIISFLAAFQLTAQTKFLDSLKAAYPDQKALYLKNATVLRYSIKNDSLRLETENSFDKLILSENANMFSEKSIYYSDLIRVKNLEAKTIVYNGSKEKAFKNFAVKDQDAVEPGIFYDDLKSKEIQFPNVVKGSRMIMSYTNEYLEPRMYGPVHMAAEYPVIEATCTVIFPANMKIEYRLLGLKENEVDFKKEENAKTITYTWRTRSVKEIDYYSDGPNPKGYMPQIAIYVKEFEIKGQKQKVADGSRGLYDWCFSFASKARQNESNLLKPLVDSLTSKEKTEKQKSEKIFYWVQDNIRYLAFEDGYGGYIPRNAEDIYKKRYGDCKDMANIITTMHRLAGLKSYLVWIGTRDIPYQLEQVPLPCAFNHMISVANIDNEWIFLDATGKYYNHGFPTDMIQTKEALISISADSCLIMKVPEVTQEKNITEHKLELYLAGNSLKGKGRKSIKGLPKANFLQSYYHVESSDKDNFWSNNLRYGNNKCEASNYKVENAAYYDKEFAVNFDITLPDYALTVNNEIFVNLNLKKDYYDAKIEDNEKRKVGIEYDMKQISDHQVILEIPKGYTLSYLPEKISYDHAQFGFEIWYEKKENKIIYHKKITIRTLEVQPSDFNAWNEMVRKLNKAYKESITLKKTN